MTTHQYKNVGGDCMLQNTLYRLTQDRQLRIVYFGGSVTDGTGASNPNKTSYRALVTDWFRRTWPEAEILEVNASIGGTGTGYGMFRCEQDVLAHHPDLVFLAFSDNDWGDTYENVFPQTETIFRKIRRLAPYADIVTVFTTEECIMTDTEQGREYTSRSAQAAASHVYGVPTIDPGVALHAHILRNGGIYTDFLPDHGHPNDAGYRVMADCVISVLADWLHEAGRGSLCRTEHALPAPISDRVCDDAHITECSALDDLSLHGFRVVTARPEERFAQYLESTHPGDRFSFRFRGKGLGIYWMGGNRNGDVFVQIDDEEPIRVRSWDHYVRSFHRMQAAMVRTDLSPDDTHRVTITTAEFTPTEESPDAFVRIGAMFLC